MQQSIIDPVSVLVCAKELLAAKNTTSISIEAIMGEIIFLFFIFLLF